MTTMQINVAQFLKAPIGTTRKFPISEVVETPNGDLRVEGEVLFTRTHRSILVKGTLHTEVEMTCSRCLSPFKCPLRLCLEEEFFPTIDVNTGAVLPPPEEPEAFRIDERNILDLTEAVRQYILLSTPMKPLCDEGCPGLCPTCGHNLNQGTCGCLKQPADVRWDILQKLRVPGKQEEEKEEKGTD